MNEQRAVGGQEPLVNPTDEQYLAVLCEQRAREFSIDGHRIGRPAAVRGAAQR